MIEPESSRLAAQRANNKEIDAIWAAYSVMKDYQHDEEQWSRADLQFHLAIAAASHNPLIQSILDPLTEPLSKVIVAGLTEQAAAQAGLEAHNQITTAIENHDPERAYSAMFEHLLDSERRLLRIGFDLQGNSK